MAIASPTTISHSGITDKVNFDIFKDDQYVADDLAAISSDYQNNGIWCAIDVLLDSDVSCQIKINNGTWQNFLYNTAYSIGSLRNIKSVMLSANNINYHINITVE